MYGELLCPQYSNQLTLLEFHYYYLAMELRWWALPAGPAMMKTIG